MGLAKGGAKEGAAEVLIRTPEASSADVMPLPMPPIPPCIIIPFLFAANLLSIAVNLSGDPAIIQAWYRHSSTLPVFHWIEKLAGLGVLPNLWQALRHTLPAALRGRLGLRNAVAGLAPLVLLPSMIASVGRANKLSRVEGGPQPDVMPELSEMLALQALLNLALFWQAQAVFWSDPEVSMAAGLRHPESLKGKVQDIADALKPGKVPKNWEVVEMIVPPLREIAVLGLLLGQSVIELGVDLTGDAELLQGLCYQKNRFPLLQEVRLLVGLLVVLRLVQALLRDVPAALRGVHGSWCACAPLLLVPAVCLVAEEASRACTKQTHQAQLALVFVSLCFTLAVAAKQNGPGMVSGVRPHAVAAAKSAAPKAAAAKASTKPAGKKTD